MNNLANLKEGLKIVVKNNVRHDNYTAVVDHLIKKLPNEKLNIIVDSFDNTEYSQQLSGDTSLPPYPPPHPPTSFPPPTGNASLDPLDEAKKQLNRINTEQAEKSRLQKIEEDRQNAALIADETSRQEQNAKIRQSEIADAATNAAENEKRIKEAEFISKQNAIQFNARQTLKNKIKKGVQSITNTLGITTKRERGDDVNDLIIFYINSSLTSKDKAINIIDTILPSLSKNAIDQLKTLRNNSPQFNVKIKALYTYAISNKATRNQEITDINTIPKISGGSKRKTKKNGKPS